VTSPLVLSFREGVELTSPTEGELEWKNGNMRVAFKRISPIVRTALQHIGGGVCEDQLVAMLMKADGGSELPRLYYYLHRLAQRGILLRTAQLNGKPLGTLTPISASFVFNGRDVAPESRCVISRFAYMHKVGGEMVLESPLAHARLTLYDWRAAAFVQSLAQPSNLTDVLREVPDLTADAANQLQKLLVGAGLAEELNETGTAAEESHSALQVWEFHDLLFHTRSRAGRHDNPVGATYRFVDKLDSPPALKSTKGTETIDLYRPDIDRLQREDPPFSHVQEHRQSIRVYGDPPINAKQLGEFLFRVARVKDHTEIDVGTPTGQVRMDFARRPYPGGGALYELELYVVISNCADLAPGLYHYQPLTHRLGRIADRTDDVAMLLRSASFATTIPAEDLQVNVIIAARFQRIAWKYSSMAYAAILKHVGVMYQTMYLAATAMGLAPCGIGCGDSDLFARAAGTDYVSETSVGEFLLGSRQVDL
jgi:SagB-type dehydrogenase family enzyme